MKKQLKLIKNYGLINTFNFYTSTTHNLKLFEIKRKFSLTPVLYNIKNIFLFSRNSVLFYNQYGITAKVPKCGHIKNFNFMLQLIRSFFILFLLN